MAAIKFIQPSFSAGEISPELWGRVDLAKYRTGAATLRNMYVDYRGGASNRPGTQIVGPCQTTSASLPPLLVPFRFNDEQTYMLELNHLRMRIIDNGEYVTQAAVNINAITQANPPVITTTGNHGLATGDYFYVDGVVGMLRTNGVSGLNGRIFKAGAVTATTVALVDPFGFTVNSTGWTAYSSGGTTAEIINITTPWADTILYELKFVQSADVLTVTHDSVVPTNITRSTGGVWAVTAESFGPQLFPPTTTSAAGHNCSPGGDSYTQYYYRYVITAVDNDTGDESAASAIATATCARLNPYGQNGVTIITVSWSAVSGNNISYRIYKTQSVPTTAPGGGSPYAWGLIGETSGTVYRDLNYEPDFTRAPPTLDNPFSDGIIESVAIVDAGFGYLNPVVTVTDPNSEASGAVLAAVIDSAGAFTGINVSNGGSRYTAPVIAIAESGGADGSGATMSFDGTWVASGGTNVPDVGSITITDGGEGYHVPRITAAISACSGGGVSTNGSGYGIVTDGVLTDFVWDVEPSRTTSTTDCIITFTITDSLPEDGLTPSAEASATATLGDEINPACVAYFQQRKVYAGGDAPRTFFMTRPGLFNSFDVHYPTQDDDAITGNIVGNDVNAILSLVPMPTGLIAFTSSGAFLITGGGENNAVTPTNINANPQVSSGASALQPILVGSDIIYKQARGTAVRSLAFAFEIDGFTGTDLSALSSHLLQGASITQWAWAEEPLHLVWGVRDDGVLLSLAYIKDQQVYGWSRHDTLGKFVSVASVPEGAEDAVYVIVRRAINGGYYYVTERFASRSLGGNPALNLPTNVEDAWFVDSGARYPLTYPAAQLLASATSPVWGEITSASIVAGGAGYTAGSVVSVVDPTGTGAEITITVTAGAITGVTIVDGGANYTSPVLSVSGGANAIIVLTPTNTQIFDLSASVGAGTEGQVLRVGGGKGVVTAATATELTCSMSVPIQATVPNAPANTLPPVIAESGEWSLTDPVTVVGGLDHLEGQYVVGLADGSFVTPRLVSDGCVTLDAAATSIVLGLGYSAQLQTLRWEIDGAAGTTQGRRKQMPELVLRAMNTRGITVGPSFTRLSEVKERDQENFGQPIALQTGGGTQAPLYENGPTAPIPVGYSDKTTALATEWSEDGVVCVQQSYPLPVTLLALIPSIAVGDDPD